MSYTASLRDGKDNSLHCYARPDVRYGFATDRRAGRSFGDGGDREDITKHPSPSIVMQRQPGSLLKARILRCLIS